MTRRAPLTLDDPRMVTIRRYTDGAIDSLQAASRLGMTRRAFNRLVEAARRIDPSLPKRGASDFRLHSDELDYEDAQRRDRAFERRAGKPICWTSRAHALFPDDEALARSLARAASFVAQTRDGVTVRLVPPRSEGAAA